MSRTTYADTLLKSARDRYRTKFLCLYNLVGDSREDYVDKLDPYQLVAEQWIDYISRWPTVEYPDLCTYLIKTPGEFMKKKLKAFKSLEAYNYYKRYVIVAACTSPSSQQDVNGPQRSFSIQRAGCTPFVIMILDRTTRIASWSPSGFLKNLMLPCILYYILHMLFVYAYITMITQQKWSKQLLLQVHYQLLQHCLHLMASRWG